MRKVPKLKFWIGGDLDLLIKIVNEWVKKFDSTTGPTLDGIIEGRKKHLKCQFVYQESGGTICGYYMEDAKELFEHGAKTFKLYKMTNNCKCNTNFDRFHLQWCPVNYPLEK